MTAPDVSPWTKYRWKTRNTTITGMTAITEAANTSPHSVEFWPWNSAMASGRVCLVGVLMMVSAQANSSQLARKVKMVAVASAGLASGRISRQ